MIIYPSKICEHSELFHADGVPKRRKVRPKPDPRLLHMRTDKVRNTQWARAEKPYTDVLGKAPSKSMLSSGEHHLLYDVAKRLGPGNYANLGTGRGGSTVCLASGLKHNRHAGTVFAIDTYAYRVEGFRVEEVDSFFKQEGLDEYIVICKGLTYNWAEEFKDLLFKFVFIDADHNYESCRLDFDMWSPLVEAGGEIAFNDAHNITVDKVIQEIDPTIWRQINHIFSTKLFQKLKD